MSGHSKWASIKHKKGAADAKRGKIFSKLSKAITVTAREGGTDPDMNFSLRLAIDKAKAANMPKDNIDRAIQKAAGGGEGGDLTTAVYEGMGPGGCALIIEAVTDNTNRTISSLKGIFNKRGANIDAKVMWMFDRKGVVHVENASSIEDKDVFELALIDAGAEDISRADNRLSVICDISELQKVSEAVKAAGLEIESAGLEYVAKDEVQLSAEDEAKLGDFIEALEDDDDVEAVYTNAA